MYIYIYILHIFQGEIKLKNKVNEQKLNKIKIKKWKKYILNTYMA